MAMFYKKPAPEGLLTDIRSGASFVKANPETIGDLVWYDSDNYLQEPKEKADRPKLFAKLMGAVAGAYKGSEFFVGTDGFAEYHFAKTRDNFDTIKEIPYDDVSILAVLLEITDKDDDLRAQRDFDIGFLPQPDADGIARSLYTTHCLGNTVGYHFMTKAEEGFTAHVADKARQQLDTGNPFTFYTVRQQSKGSDIWQTEEIIRLHPDGIYFDGQFYEGDALKRVRLWKDRLEFVGEGLGAKLLRSRNPVLPLKNLGNRKAFQILLAERYGINLSY